LRRRVPHEPERSRTTRPRRARGPSPSSRSRARRTPPRATDAIASTTPAGRVVSATPDHLGLGHDAVDAPVDRTDRHAIHDLQRERDRDRGHPIAPPLQEAVVVPAAVAQPTARPIERDSGDHDEVELDDVERGPCGFHRSERGLAHRCFGRRDDGGHLVALDPWQRDGLALRTEAGDQRAGVDLAAERPEGQHGFGARRLGQTQEPVGDRPAPRGPIVLGDGVALRQDRAAQHPLGPLQPVGREIAHADDPGSGSTSSAITSSRSGGPPGTSTDHVEPAAASASRWVRSDAVVPDQTPSSPPRAVRWSSRRPTSSSSRPTTTIPAQVAETGRSPAASRSTRTLRVNSSSPIPQPFHASASAAARRTTASAKPPIQIGGPPGRTGGGRSGPVIAATCEPPSHPTPRYRDLMARTVSTRCSRRSAFSRYSMPKTRCSSSSIGSPVPIPRIMRPPLTSSTAAASFASIPALRSVALVTKVPTAMRVVPAATALSVAYASSDCRSGEAPGGNRWSNAKTPSNPRSSARRAKASTRAASPENIGRTSPTFTSDHHAPELLEREGCRPHGSGVVAELGRDDRNAGAMLGSLDRVQVGGARGVEQEVAGDDRAAADDDDLGVKDVHEAGDPLTEPSSDLREDPPRRRVTLPRRLRDELAGHLAGVAAGETTQVRVLVLASFLPAHPIDRPPGGDLLPAAAVAAAAKRAVGLDDDVADLGGEAVRAPEQPAVRHDPTADPGAHRDEQQMPVPATGAEPILAVGGHARVVVYLAGKTERVAHPLGDREVAPGEVWGEAQDPLLRVDQPGGPH